MVVYMTPFRKQHNLAPVLIYSWIPSHITNMFNSQGNLNPLTKPIICIGQNYINTMQYSITETCFISLNYM